MILKMNIMKMSSDKLLDAALVMLIICAIIQIVCIVTVAHNCAKQGYSVACVGSTCRCVNEIK